MRAVAVVLVVLYHAGVPGLRSGYVGVDVFFVISGFLITGLLIREQEAVGHLSLTGFYARRMRRILPAATLVVTVTVLAARHYQNFITYAASAQDARWATLFAANFHFAIISTNYFAQVQAPSPLLHFWSLAVEEQFYLAWPTLILLVGAAFRRSPRAAVTAMAVFICVASFSWALHQVHSDPTWAYYSPLTRAWELAVGAVAATLTSRSAKLRPTWGVTIALGGLVAIVLSALVFNDSTLFPGLPALLPVLGAAAVIVGGQSGGGARALLGIAPVRSVGRVSYGWYLLHYPPMILLAGVFWRGPLSVGERLVISAVTLAAAFILYSAFENPIRRSKQLAEHPLLSIGITGSLVLVAFLVASVVHKGLA